ncbi:MAG: rhamnogalacturonan acetylesterase, partial [Lachnospiraceae bacterium]|nr:rhamnogalacturonan acetylesterase [Lachnospiraceae bacterium]
PYYFSVKVPDGNYKVTVTLGDRKRAGHTMVRAENRRLMLEPVATRKGETKEVTINVNKREPAINLMDSVRLNPREIGTPTWDDKLTLEFTGDAPAVQSVKIEPIEDVTTVFLCGNSTVVDQKDEPWCSWGQIVPAYFDKTVVISNQAESGERTTSFMNTKRLDKVLSMAKPGDWIIMEFGHNDEKDRHDGAGAWYNFSTNLKIFLDRARRAGLNPVFITPTARRFFDENGKVSNTHGEYPDAMKAVAQREGVPVIDLTAMSATLYETLGEEGSKKAFVHYPAGSFPGQTDALKDNTHFNPYGATQLAKCVLKELRDKAPELGEHITWKEEYSPASPDAMENFYWPDAPFFDAEKPYGN